MFFTWVTNLNIRQIIIKTDNNNYFRLEFYVCIIWMIILIMYGIRKGVHEFKNKSAIVPSNPNRYNSSVYNPEITNLKMTYCAVILFPIIGIPATYVYYIAEDTGPGWSEFEYFLMDLAPHVTITVILPLIIYLQNDRLRKFVFNWFV